MPNKTIALVCLAFNPQLYYRKIFHALWQTYPQHLKTLILLYQPDKTTGEFPTPIATPGFPFKIIQENVEAQWPGAWAFKWRRACEIALEFGIDYLVVFDEDDEYPPWWVEQMVKVIENEKTDGAWSWFNIDAKRGSIKGFADPEPYDAPSGTLVIATRFMAAAIERLFQKWPQGKRHNAATGTADMTVSKFLMDDCVVSNVRLDGPDNRGYFRYGLANTNKRNPEDDIDFGFEYGPNLAVKIRCDEPARIGKAHMKKARLISAKTAKPPKAGSKALRTHRNKTRGQRREK